MPPLQRTVVAPELVTDPSGFRAGLGTWQNASFLGTLGHLVDLEAPSGVGHGLAMPSPPADTPNPAARTPPTVNREVGPVVARELATPRSAPVRRVAEGAATPDAPEVVEPLISARPPDERIRQLTTLPLATPRPAAAAGDVPPTTSPSPPVQRSAALGLGEPLTELPPTAQRTPVASTGALTPEQPEAVPPELPRGDAPSRPLLADDPLVVRTADTGTPSAPTPTTPPVPLQRATAGGMPMAAEPAPAAGPVVPLVAQRSVPLFSGAYDMPDRPGGSGPVPAAEPPVVPVRWSAAGGPARTSPGATAAGGTSATNPPTTPTAQRSAAPTAQRSAAPTAAAPPPPATGHRPTAPTPATAPTAPARPPVDAGSVAVAAGVAQRMADGSVVFPPSRVPSVPPAPSAPRIQRRARFLPPVQRDAMSPDPPDAPAPDPPAPPDLSAEPPSAPPPAVPPAAGPPFESAPEPSPAGAPHDGTPGEPGGHGGKGGAPKVDDELVRALYGPLSRLLKAELRLERERAGHLINTRH
ncbi:hypothetical protein [Streptomyces yatensis]|nr:hypothetical protein [Streptomyces yatensis]